MGSEGSLPRWLWSLLGTPELREGQRARIGEREYLVSAGVLRDTAMEVSAAQHQTSESFGYKWGLRSTFESPSSLARMREWLIERYGEIADADWWDDHGPSPVVVDAGCGAGMSGLELFGDKIADVRYLAVDASAAVDVARDRFNGAGRQAAFLQADLRAMPLPDASVDVIFSEGVLHHTDSTKGALEDVARLLRQGGRVLFYVYRRKGPVREFTDDYIRQRLHSMSQDEAWEALLPLTKLGHALGALQVEFDVPEDIDLLGIPAGRTSVQRFIYWHVVKAFDHAELTLEELNHINYDWFAPRNAHRQSPEEVRAWCAEFGLSIERERVEPSGITIIARKH